MAQSNYVLVPAPEVRSRCAQYLSWWYNGGAESMRAYINHNVEKELYEQHRGHRCGWPWNRRTLTTKAEVLEKFWTDWEDDTVRWRFNDYKSRVEDIACLEQSATGTNSMLVLSGLWRSICQRSEETAHG